MDQVQRKMMATELHMTSMVERMLGSRTKAGGARGKVQLGEKVIMVLESAK